MATPTTLLVDARMRPELVYTGVMTSASLKIFKGAVGGNLDGVTEPFLEEGDSERVKEVR